MDELEWPREVWMAERDEHDQGVVSAVLSEHATVARWEGDKERDREFHCYIDADIFESAERYFKVQIEALQARVTELEEAFEEAAKYHDNFLMTQTGISVEKVVASTEAIRALAEKG